MIQSMVVTAIFTILLYLQDVAGGFIVLYEYDGHHLGTSTGGKERSEVLTVGRGDWEHDGKNIHTQNGF
jgi:hypothetical protein